jgi:deoxyribose-phosphate aldolase
MTMAETNLTVKSLAQMIDHTILGPDATYLQIDNLCREALESQFAAVCVNASHVSRCAQALQGSGVNVATVVGFPLGATLPQVKAYEARESIALGATEIDMVINIGALKANDLDSVAADIAGVVQVCHAQRALCKVIIEACLLTDAEKVNACRLAQAAGADFVKTSTGFSTSGATVADVQLMRQTVGPSMGVKAAGGIRTLSTAEAMIAAGATRLGTSAGAKIIRELLNSQATT